MKTGKRSWWFAAPAAVALRLQAKEQALEQDLQQRQVGEIAQEDNIKEEHEPRQSSGNAPAGTCSMVKATTQKPKAKAQRKNMVPDIWFMTRAYSTMVVKTV